MAYILLYNSFLGNIFREVFNKSFCKLSFKRIFFMILVSLTKFWKEKLPHLLSYNCQKLLVCTHGSGRKGKNADVFIFELKKRINLFNTFFLFKLVYFFMVMQKIDSKSVWKFVVYSYS